MNGPGRPSKLDPGQALPRRCRIRRRRDYLKVQVEGARFSTRHLVILWVRSRWGTTRLGVTVSRKVAKQATRRNRIKRWIREAFRRLPRSPADNPAIDLVVIARPPSVEATYQDVAEQLRRFWNQPGLPRRPARDPR
jgi:ribonuclease P protein component